MYLSRLRLNLSSAAARRDLAEPYELHRTLARVYAPDDTTPPPRFLWRLERARDSGSPPTVLVQSVMPGRWDAVLALDGYVHGLDADEPVDLERHARQGRECLFRLVANATVTRDGRRFGLRSEEALAGWIRRQAERHGFELLDLRCQPLPRLRAARGRAANAIVLDPALFEGRLRVTVGDALRVALLQGIGHGKALGLGMLSLPRLR